MRKTSRSVFSQGNNSISLFVRDNNNSSISSANLPFRDSFANMRNWINVIHCVSSGFKYIHRDNLTRCVRVSWITHSGCQWRIQDFPRGGAPTLGGGGVADIWFCQIFPKTAWNWKNLDPGGPPLALPLRSATGCVLLSYSHGNPHPDH